MGGIKELGVDGRGPYLLVDRELAPRSVRHAGVEWAMEWDIGGIEDLADPASVNAAVARMGPVVRYRPILVPVIEGVWGQVITPSAP